MVVSCKQGKDITVQMDPNSIMVRIFNSCKEKKFLEKDLLTTVLAI